MPNLTLTLEDSNLSDFDAQVLRMVVRVADEKGTAVKVIFNWNANEESISCVGAADALEAVYSGSHLCALVGSFLWSKFTSDHQLLSDLFIDLEADDYRSLVMPINLPDYAGV